MKNCIKCKKPFKDTYNINGRRVRLRNRNKCLDCLPYVPYMPPSFITTNCKQCNKIIKKNTKHFDYSRNYFCSSSCAAIYNNKINIKKFLTNKCKCCGSLILKKYVFCKLCREKGKHLKNGSLIINNTIQNYIDRKGTNRYRSVRDHAKRVVSKREQKCIICGYEKHVEACHIKEIKEFSLNSTIEEINSPENLILLCPNHHWELDNKYFNILK